MLLCQGADPNARDNWNYTPLHEAAIKGKLDVCIGEHTKHTWEKCQAMTCTKGFALMTLTQKVCIAQQPSVHAKMCLVAFEGLGIAIFLVSVGPVRLN